MNIFLLNGLLNCLLNCLWNCLNQQKQDHKAFGMAVDGWGMDPGPVGGDITMPTPTPLGYLHIQ